MCDDVVCRAHRYLFGRCFFVRQLCALFRAAWIHSYGRVVVSGNRFIRLPPRHVRPSLYPTLVLLLIIVCVDCVCCRTVRLKRTAPFCSATIIPTWWCKRSASGRVSPTTTYYAPTTPKCCATVRRPSQVSKTARIVAICTMCLTRLCLNCLLVLCRLVLFYNDLIIELNCLFFLFL